MRCEKCGNILPESAKVCDVCGTRLDASPAAVVCADKKERGMRWFKFVIYVQLILNIIGNIVSGVMMLSGYRMGLSAEEYELIAEYYKGFSTVVVADGIGSLLMAAGAVYTRTMLADFRKKGPLCLYLFIGVTAIKEVSTMALFWWVTDGYVALGSLGLTMRETLVTALPGYALLILINAIYFRHRKELFVN